MEQCSPPFGAPHCLKSADYKTPDQACVKQLDILYTTASDDEPSRPPAFPRAQAADLSSEKEEKEEDVTENCGAEEEDVDRGLWRCRSATVGDPKLVSLGSESL